VLRIAKLAGLLSVVAFAATTAVAQVPGEHGFFGSIDGRWMWLGGTPTSSQGSTTQTGNGPGGQFMLGYKLSPEWDVALAGDVQGLMTELTKQQNGAQSVDVTHQHYDLETGYSQDWWRVNAGLRGIHYTQIGFFDTNSFAGYDNRQMYGIGPKAGAGARVPLSQSWALVGGADAALVYTSIADNGWNLNGASYSQFVPQFDGELGFNWRSADAPRFSLTMGGRVTTSFNTTVTAEGAQGTLLETGPFFRMAYNLSAPTRAAPARDSAAAAPPAPPASSYLVFFDFDSADLTLMADGVIRRAADDARAGHSATLRIASHSDRAGGDDYNKALGLRRVDTIKDALARLGLSPDQVSRVQIGF
jgi:outer membrane protein OmpA-like peptidoglycan-associated protein